MSATPEQIREFIAHVHGGKIESLVAVGEKIREQAFGGDVNSFRLDEIITLQGQVTVYRQFSDHVARRLEQDATLTNALQDALALIVKDQTTGFWPKRSSSETDVALAMSVAGARAEFLRDWQQVITDLSD